MINRFGYYFLPTIPQERRMIQDLFDSFPTICFVIGGAFGALTGQYWYRFLTRYDGDLLLNASLLFSPLPFLLKT